MRNRGAAVGLKVLLARLGLLMAGLGVALWSFAGVARAEERLVLEHYPTAQPWREVTHKTAGAKFWIEQIPSDQVVENYRDILSAQSFPELHGFDPSRFLSGLFTRTSGDCESVRVNGPKATVEAGYAVAYGQAYCSRQRGKDFGVHMFVKVIQGQDALYVVLREFRVPASDVAGVTVFSKDQAAAAMEMLKSESLANDYLGRSVYLCGGASTDTRCGARAAH